MIIVVDGPDAAGKSTLAKTIASKLKFQYLHTWQPPCTNGKPFDHYVDILIKSIRDDVVFDRGVFDELVYPKILNRPTDVTEGRARALTNIVKITGGTTIICLPKWDACLNNWRKNWETEFLWSEEQMLASWNLFYKILEDFEVTRFSYSEETIDNFLKYNLIPELEFGGK